MSLRERFQYVCLMPIRMVFRPTIPFQLTPTVTRKVKGRTHMFEGYEEGRSGGMGSGPKKAS